MKTAVERFVGGIVDIWPRNAGNGHSLRRRPRFSADEQPLRAELFSVDQLERHARAMAGWHELAERRGPDRLLPRLAENESVLLHTYDLVTTAVDKSRRIAPAAEWLLDNFYLIEEQIRTARRHLPRSYSRELPSLANGPAAGYPRVYGIALELISHVDGRLDGTSLNAFIASYQAIKPLTLGELWAVPIMLRLALIENLRRVAARIAAGRLDRNLANEWADKMVAVVEKNPTDLILVMADMARANVPLSSPFVTELTRHLHGQSPYFGFANSWMEHRLQDQGLTIEQLVQTENQNQAADQVSIGNSITSLRFLSSMDWREFVETMSAVDQTLRADPAGVYTRTDFATRDRCRHAVEEIAKRSRLNEFEIARKAIRLCEAAAADQPADRAAHVGFYLLDKGRPTLERVAEMRLSPGLAVAKFVRNFPLGSYLGLVLLITVAATGLLLAWCHRHGVAVAWLVPLGIVSAMCATQLGVGVVNWLATLLIAPRPLPRLDYSEGIPPEQRTVVVIPTMLSSASAIEDLIEGIEVRYLANRDPNLHFALLTDFVDAAEETLPSDAELLRLATAGIESLNAKYGAERQDIFFLFHRPRRWNPQEERWMGYERKRGKLSEFNAFLRSKLHAPGPAASSSANGDGDSAPQAGDRFIRTVGRTEILSEAKYVITLDTDTQLPRDAARELVGAISHPLNHPVFDPGGTCVVEGYSILQPRVGISLPSASRSWFVKLFAGDPGIDPYTRAVSDVYQDLFGEGSFIGKGIYDVDAFEKACNCFPENTILSHDLVESCFARSALLNDVELFEDYPSRYTADVSRRHRWVRGDWQISPWLFAQVPTADGSPAPNALSPLSKWKIFDNLRRSLVPPTLLLLLIGGWVASSFAHTPPGRHLSPGAGITLFVLGTLLVPILLSTLVSLACKPADLTYRLHFNSSLWGILRQLAQFVFAIVFLPFDAYMGADAVARTLWRMRVTHRRLLEWQTSSDAERSARTDAASFFALMWIGPAAAALTVLALCLWRQSPMVVAAPFAALWFASPSIAWWLSRPIPPYRFKLSDDQTLFLRSLSRRTWRYFEQFVTAQEHWLPPDNFQEHPEPVIASRTSPTNVGLALLANLSAWDFGYIPMAGMLRRSADTLSTMESLERYRGHFYNWYDTRSLKPLSPLYVSAVDSGNLAGHLMVFRRGLLEAIDAKVLHPRLFGGIRDTLGVLLEVARGQRVSAEPGARPTAIVSPDLLGKIEHLNRDLEHPPRTLGAAALVLQRLARASRELASALAHHAEPELGWWANALESGGRDHLDDLAHLAPWVVLPPPDPAWYATGGPFHARADALRELLGWLEEPPTLRAAAKLEETLLPRLDAIAMRAVDDGSGAAKEAAADFLRRLRDAIVDASNRATQRITELEAAAQRCHELASMDFQFLLDRRSDLFAIGYNVSDHRLDASFYDLLASEARLASFVAIAQEQVEQDHWFALGRLLTFAGGAPALLSWSGSMFEYLMPLLVMPTYDNTLLDQTYKAVVRRQIAYGKQRGVPWGVSESGYNATDSQMNYQYRAFGVPGLGLKRGLAEDLVIAPYASVMALMVAPRESVQNLQLLSADGQQGAFGFYEAIDYTASRVPPGQKQVTIRSFMSHHEGMSLLSLAYLLLDRPMQRRFECEELFKATDLLLQERVPKAAAPVFPHATEAGARRASSAENKGTMRVFTDPSSFVPEVHLLSNGRYHVMVSSAGGGYSRWRDLAVTRWREDGTRDCWGTFVYLRDVDQKKIWSAAHQPVLAPCKQYEAIFTQARAEFRRRDWEIDSHTEISVSPEDDIELRRTTITNRSSEERTIEITSYAEVVLAPAGQDLAHPAFSNLFVQTELARERQAIFCTRRPRSMGERPPHMLHLMTVHGPTTGDASFETDRSRFIGRGRGPANPVVMDRPGPLSDTAGPVLDPIVSIRRTVRIGPDQTVRVDVITGAGETREAVNALLEKYHDPRLCDRVFELAWTHSHVVLQHLNAAESDAQLYGRLAGSVVYPTGLRRANPSIIARNRRGQSGLWGFGISGDLPIVLVRIRAEAGLPLVRQAVQAHAYWRNKGLNIDLVIWNEDHSVYRQNLHETITSFVAASPEAALVDKPGGIFIRRGEQLSEDDRVLLQSVARVILLEEAGSLAEQIEKRGRAEPALLPHKPSRQRRPEPLTAAETTRRDLVYHNGFGGFTQDGREYVVSLKPDANTPLPWANVIANPFFGTVVTESGSVYTWAENSHEYRITPWYNDPVGDNSGECLYVRDEETGRFWSPTPLPVRGPMPYVCRHGFGYSIFEYEDDGIATELTIFVAIDAAVKFVRLKVFNRSGRTRRLSFTAFWELVLGELRHKTAMQVVTELDPKTGALFARNSYDQDFADRVAFFDTADASRTVTGDRTEFLGRNGLPADPAAMRRAKLSNRVGAALDPAAAMQVMFELEHEQDREIIFTLGAARGADQARALVTRFRGAASARAALEGVWNYWNRTLGVVYVETPDNSVNFLANGWLLYQTLACRMWARTGFYQSGGAYGFRDQLQDSMAMLHAEPRLLREQLLRAAARQFREGDVQHWWHPPTGRGVRTHFSDDYLWLPYVACRYVLGTGDTGVLDEKIPFLEARALRPDEESSYDRPQISDDVGTLYEHCVRAIRNGLRFGAHGLPLMGCGDWNDGMNLVGEHGKGESVWLAFFLYDVLMQFGRVAIARNDAAFAAVCSEQAKTLQQMIEANAWDGAWYRRAYFDNGEPLGSSQNPECQIDSLPQSWSILTGAGDPARAREAMEQVDRRLVRRDTRLIQLFDPPFDRSPLNPGYIRGYVPGVRENGGQYTHAAVWTVMAFAALGDTARAWELFNLINPVAHASNARQIAVYKAEPYVVAADVYAVSPHTGRGGWTWYTGSAGWMYRLITESLLGLQLEVDRLRITPCIPAGWKSFKLHYRYRETFYHITIVDAAPGVAGRVTLDGTAQANDVIHLVDDRRPHQVEIVMGPPIPRINSFPPRVPPDEPATADTEGGANGSVAAASRQEVSTMHRDHGP